MGCKRTQRLGRFSKPIHACWEVVNEIRYERVNKRFYRIIGRKKIYMNFLFCETCSRMFLQQCLNINTSPCLPDVKSFTCNNCFK
jgi:hypothetical protein